MRAAHGTLGERKRKGREMQKLLNKSIAVFTACALAMGMVALPMNVGEAHAAEKSSKATSTKTTTKKTAAKKTSKTAMGKLKLRWSLKKNKKLSITEPYVGIGAKKSTVVMKNYKVRKTKNRPGFKTVSFDVVKTLNWKPTKKEVHKMMNSNYYVDTESVGGGVFIAAVDRKTGKSLGASNKYGVKMRLSTWKNSKPMKAVRDEDRCHTLALYKQSKVHVAIEIPVDYKDLCIGIGGFNRVTETKNDTKFWNGKVSFAKTSYYKNAKTKNGKKLSSYWMRVK